MNRREVVEALAQFCAVYRYEIDDLSTHVWARELSGVHVADGEAATRALLRTKKFMPTPSEFLALANTERERRAPTVKALDVPQHESTRERIAAIIADAKAKSATRGEHQHGGPAPCPVCGGLNPAARSRLEHNHEK